MCFRGGELLMARIKNNISVQGFFRMKIVDHAKDGSTKVVGDSGWKKNLVTNLGFQHYIIEPMGAITGSSTVAYFALGTGTAPAVADTALLNELGDAAACRFTMTPSVVSSKTLQMVGTLNSNIITANRTINNVGVFAVSSTGLGSILCGNTYATSQLQTNQSVNVFHKRHLLEIVKRKLREFGGYLEQTIPSLASNKIEEGVQTMYEVTLWVKDIVGTLLGNREYSRNIYIQYA